jgi:DNA-binding NarL/FixJ family response regulator
MIRIFLAESDPELRVGLQFLINQQHGCKVIGISDNGNELPSQVKISKPEILLLDWNLPGEPINELIAAVRALDLPLKIIVMSIHPEDESEVEFAGIDHFVTKDKHPDDLMKLLKTMKSQTTNDNQVTGKGE